MPNTFLPRARRTLLSSGGEPQARQSVGRLDCLISSKRDVIARHAAENRITNLRQNPETRPAQKQKGPPAMRMDLLRENPGGVLLSHTASRAVPSAPKSLTSEFGMGSGVASSMSPPENFGSFIESFAVKASLATRILGASLPGRPANRTAGNFRCLP